MDAELEAHRAQHFGDGVLEALRKPRALMKLKKLASWKKLAIQNRAPFSAGCFLLSVWSTPAKTVQFPLGSSLVRQNKKGDPPCGSPFSISCKITLLQHAWLMPFAAVSGPSGPRPVVRRQRARTHRAPELFQSP